jgi:SWI/SNF-related matrix-associated actin-dependent regulator of chromatin subfamily A member 5
MIAHFINLAKMKSSDKSQFQDFTTDEKTSKYRYIHVRSAKSGRTRKSEKEEDAEMLEKADHEDEENVFEFTETPACILTLT